MTQRQIARVTGSASGIGLGIAISLAEAGYRLILNGFGDPEVIDQSVADIAAVSASSLLSVGTDLTQPQAIETALAEIIASEGPISVLVNNAGMQFATPVDAFAAEKWDQIITLNLSAAKHGLIGLTKATARETPEIDFTCNAICPGWIHTPLIQEQIEKRATDFNFSVF